MKRIGMLTSGGDCQGLNAALRGVAKTLYQHYGSDVQIFGIRDGYRGLIEGDYHPMAPADFSGILVQGGTILGTSRQPFKKMQVEENGVDKVARMKETYNKMVTLPKTIDNDLWGTDMTFGFQSAVDIATNVLDCIHTTATSHGRVFIVEVMGHKVGWLTLHAGIAGGADVILLPEIPYDVDKIAKVLSRRNEMGKRFSILAVAEGALSKEEAKLSKKEFKAARAKMTEPSISYRLAGELASRTGQEIRVTIPGHFQRGGSPCAFDKMLSTRFGAAAGKLIIKEQYGYMVGLRDNKVVPVPLCEVAGKLKTVPVDCQEVKTARLLGISLGD